MLRYVVSGPGGPTVHNVLCDGGNWRVQCVCIPKLSLLFSLCVGKCYLVKCTYSLIHLWSQRVTICAMEARATVYLRITTTFLSILKVPIHTYMCACTSYRYGTCVSVYYRYAILKYVTNVCLYILYIQYMCLCVL